MNWKASSYAMTISPSRSVTMVIVTVDGPGDWLAGGLAVKVRSMDTTIQDTLGL